MSQSHVIDVEGVFVGAAVCFGAGYRFVATDRRLDRLDGSISATLAEVKRMARGVFLANTSQRQTIVDTAFTAGCPAEARDPGCSPGYPPSA